MALFVFNRKAKENENSCKTPVKPACACNGDVPAYEAKSACCCGESKQISTCCEEAYGIRSIKVLGSGCRSCHEVYENVKKAMKELALSVEVEYITDMNIVMEYGVMSMPAIVVNEQVVSMGKILKSAEVIKLLGKLGY